MKDPFKELAYIKPIAPCYNRFLGIVPLGNWLINVNLIFLVYLFFIRQTVYSVILIPNMILAEFKTT